jgi:hypothetical protein
MFIICLLLLLSLAVRAAAADTCILIDTDADLNDYRAIAALASGKQIRAIIVTEGISRRAEGAVAMQDFLRRSELTIPVLVGVSPDPYREYEERKGLLDWRRIAESLNGVLNSVGISSPAESDVAIAIRPYINDCSKITLLMIGPWTSFMKYATAILPRIDRIVAQGRPYPDEIGGEPDGFNCVYDKQSCFAAFDLLAGRQLRGRRRVPWPLLTEALRFPTFVGHADLRIMPNGFAKTSCSRGFVAGRAIVVLLPSGIV